MCQITTNFSRLSSIFFTKVMKTEQEHGVISTNDLDFVDRFSVLILSDENGAVVKEALPPKQ